MPSQNYRDRAQERRNAEKISDLDTEEYSGIHDFENLFAKPAKIDDFKEVDSKDSVTEEIVEERNKNESPETPETVFKSEYARRICEAALQELSIPPQATKFQHQKLFYRYDPSLNPYAIPTTVQRSIAETKDFARRNYFRDFGNDEDGYILDKIADLWEATRNPKEFEEKQCDSVVIVQSVGAEEDRPQIVQEADMKTEENENFCLFEDVNSQSEETDAEEELQVSLANRESVSYFDAQEQNSNEALVKDFTCNDTVNLSKPEAFTTSSLADYVLDPDLDMAASDDDITIDPDSQIETSMRRFKQKQLKPWDFDNEEDFARYKEAQTVMPRAAFQFGVKLGDGRKKGRDRGKVKKHEDEAKKFEREARMVDKVMRAKFGVGLDDGENDKTKRRRKK